MPERDPPLDPPRDPPRDPLPAEEAARQRAYADAYYGYAPLVSLSRPLVLIGMPGAETVAVCNAMASLTGLPLIDLSRRVEHDAGRSVSHIFLREGERMLRAREAALLMRAVEERPAAIIACGPGAWSKAEIRRALPSRADTLALHRPVGALVHALRAAVARSPGSEPDFMGGQPIDPDRVRQICAEHAPHHAVAARRFEAGELHPTRVAEALMGVLGWASAAG